MRGRFALASTDKSVDAIVEQLLRLPTFPQLSPSAYAFVLDALTEQHGSTDAFVKQLRYLLLRIIAGRTSAVVS